MAYIGHDLQARAEARAKARAKTPKGALPPLAWERVLVIVASVMAWVGIIAVIRAFF
jgi:hypothetical protein